GQMKSMKPEHSPSWTRSLAEDRSGFWCDLQPAMSRDQAPPGGLIGMEDSVSESTSASELLASEVTFRGKSWKPQDIRLRAALLDAERRLNDLQSTRDKHDKIVMACRRCFKRADEEARRGA